MCAGEPIQRAYSQFKMEVERGSLKLGENETFAQRMKSEIARGPPRHRKKEDQVWRGLYDEQMARLQQWIGAARLKIIVSERVFSSPKAMELECGAASAQPRFRGNVYESLHRYETILDFLHVTRVARFRKVFKNPGSSKVVGGGLDGEARQVLRVLYKNDTARLYERLGAPICEWESWYREQELLL